ncbi:MAG: pentapeptide repeat-containing protein [Marivibrio sp.]|uniref:pentapeptide repeat-containing protein n=1 Tax=Marivibrio sp. TaxID=2039719 RepID=UPI0032F03C55
MPNRGEVQKVVQNRHIDHDNLSHGGVVRSLSFYNCVFQNTDLYGIIFLNCTFNLVEFVSCDLGGAQFLNCSFSRMAAAHSNFSRTLFERCSLQRTTKRWGARIQACNFDGAVLDFNGALISRCLLDDVALKRLVVRDAKFSALYMRQCALEEARFKSCRFAKVNLFSASFRGVVFESSKIDRIEASVSKLLGLAACANALLPETLDLLRLRADAVVKDADWGDLHAGVSEYLRRSLVGSRLIERVNAILLASHASRRGERAISVQELDVASSDIAALFNSKLPKEANASEEAFDLALALQTLALNERLDHSIVRAAAQRISIIASGKQGHPDYLRSAQAVLAEVAPTVLTEKYRVMVSIRGPSHITASSKVRELLESASYRDLITVEAITSGSSRLFLVLKSRWVLATFIASLLVLGVQIEFEFNGRSLSKAQIGFDAGGAVENIVRAVGEIISAREGGQRLSDVEIADGASFCVRWAEDMSHAISQPVSLAIEARRASAADFLSGSESHLALPARIATALSPPHRERGT